MNSKTAPICRTNLVTNNTRSKGLFSGVLPVLTSAFSSAYAGWKKYNNHLVDRRAFQNMLELDDAILNDIGVTRSEVIWANKLPLSINAAEELNIISLSRRHSA